MFGRICRRRSTNLGNIKITICQHPKLKKKSHAFHKISSVFGILSVSCVDRLSFNSFQRNQIVLAQERGVPTVSEQASLAAHRLTPPNRPRPLSLFLWWHREILCVTNPKKNNGRCPKSMWFGAPPGYALNSAPPIVLLLMVTQRNSLCNHSK